MKSHPGAPSPATLMAPTNSRASAAMALMFLSTSVPPSAPAAENGILVENHDKPVFQKQACSVDEGVTARHPFSDLGNTPTAATGTAKKKKKTQRKPTPAANSLKDAKSELGTDDGE